MKYRAMRDHDHESIHRAAALLRYYHAGTDRAWLATLSGDTRPGGHYATMCALAAITDRLVGLIADWTGADHDTILTNNELAIVKTIPRTHTEKDTQ